MSEIKTQLFIHGMKNDSCIATASKALATLPGFISAAFDLAEGVGVVMGDIDPQAACQLLAEQGYPAVVKSA